MKVWTDKKVEENKIAIEEAASIGAEMIVLVCGATPGQSLEVSRSQIQDGIEKILPLAESLKVVDKLKTDNIV